MPSVPAQNILAVIFPGYALSQTLSAIIGSVTCRSVDGGSPIPVPPHPVIVAVFPAVSKARAVAMSIGVSPVADVVRCARAMSLSNVDSS